MSPSSVPTPARQPRASGRVQRSVASWYPPKKRNRTAMRASESNRRERLAQNSGDRVDVVLLRDQCRRDDRRVARRLEMQTVIEQLLLERVAARAGTADRMHVDRPEHAIAANVGHRRQVLEREQRIQEI